MVFIDMGGYTRSITSAVVNLQGVGFPFYWGLLYINLAQVGDLAFDVPGM